MLVKSFFYYFNITMSRFFILRKQLLIGLTNWKFKKKKKELKIYIIYNDKEKI